LVRIRTEDAGCRPAKTWAGCAEVELHNRLLRASGKRHGRPIGQGRIGSGRPGRGS